MLKNMRAALGIFLNEFNSGGNDSNNIRDHLSRKGSLYLFSPRCFLYKKNLTVSRVGSGPGGPGFYSCKLHVRNLPFRAGT